MCDSSAYPHGWLNDAYHPGACASSTSLLKLVRGAKPAARLASADNSPPKNAAIAGDTRKPAERCVSARDDRLALAMNCAVPARRPTLRHPPPAPARAMTASPGRSAPSSSKGWPRARPSLRRRPRPRSARPPSTICATAARAAPSTSPARRRSGEARARCIADRQRDRAIERPGRRRATTRTATSSAAATITTTASPPAVLTRLDNKVAACRDDEQERLVGAVAEEFEELLDCIEVAGTRERPSEGAPSRRRLGQHGARRAARLRTIRADFGGDPCCLLGTRVTWPRSGASR